MAGGFAGSGFEAASGFACSFATGAIIPGVGGKAAPERGGAASSTGLSAAGFAAGACCAAGDAGDGLSDC
jgi:hypothetical protein